VTVQFYHAHTTACDPVCVLDQFREANPFVMVEPWNDVPPPLLPDDDTAVERLAPVVEQVMFQVHSTDGHMTDFWTYRSALDGWQIDWRKVTAAIIERLRAGGQR